MIFLVPAAIILVLIVANAVFVAAEFAIVGAPRASIDHQAAQGNRLARRVAEILDDPTLQDRYIATTQIGISVASLGLGMYGEHQIEHLVAPALESFGSNQWIAAHTLASIIAVAILTYLHIVIGEMVPKALALQRAQHTVLYVSPLVNAVEVPIRPLVWALNGIGTGLLGLVGIERQETEGERYHTTEELQFIIQESQEGGLLRGEAGRILRELFEFGDLEAAQAMVPRVRLVGIPLGTGAEGLKDIVRRSPHTRYPVFRTDLDNIVGSVHIKDLLGHIVAGRPITDSDARPLPHVPATMALDQVLSAMRRYRSQMAVVMDEHGGTAGLVTIEDLFEEVVGDIEEGRARPPIAREGGGQLRVRGTVRLKDAADALNGPLAHPDVQTISGLVLALLGRPAVVGDAVTCNGFRLEVTSVAGRGVAEAVITRVPPAAA